MSDQMTSPADESSSPPRSGFLTFLSRTFRLLLLVGILGAGIAVTVYWMTHKPKAQRRKPPAMATLVETRRAQRTTHPVVVHAMGTVIPAQSIKLAARVGGEVVETATNFLPGGRFSAGDPLLKIDPADYELAAQQAAAELQRRQAELAQRDNDVKLKQLDLTLQDIAIERSKVTVRQRETQVVRAESALALEQGQQAVARREYALLGEAIAEGDRELVLRAPQLLAARADIEAATTLKEIAETDVEAAEASRQATEVTCQTAAASREAAAAIVASAEASVRKAQLDLERTVVKAPFNALVADRSVDVGSQVSPGSTLASLVGTDEYWIQVSVPVDQLKWIDIPGVNGDIGSTVRVYHSMAWGEDVSRTGTVKQLMTELEPQGRMARLLVSVPDPLGTDAVDGEGTQLILGSYVRVRIDGRDVENVVQVPRTALRDGKLVWVAKEDRTLDIRRVSVVWGSTDHVYISDGVEDGDELIVSDLGTPVQGMALRKPGDPVGTPEGGPSGASAGGKPSGGAPSGRPDGGAKGKARE